MNQNSHQTSLLYNSLVKNVRKLTKCKADMKTILGGWLVKSSMTTSLRLSLVRIAEVTGGIFTLKDAILWLLLMKEELGN